MFARLALALALVCGFTCHAGILFEPYAGYSLGDLKRSYSEQHPSELLRETETEGHADGFAYGGRLGWTFGQLVVGAEYQGVRGDVKGSGGQESRGWTSSAIFGILGLQFLSGIRLFGGMSVQDVQVIEQTEPERTKYEGKAMKAGIGYRYRAPVAINVEYVMYDMDKMKIGGDEYRVSDTFESFKYSTVILSLSFPFEMN
ncbi:MAG TPA: hypothetical protein PKC28_00650 [Bdellovibrionales bacterium]|nr:hypothetical protein [Bdellovibrionales bacterium]